VPTSRLLLFAAVVLLAPVPAFSQSKPPTDAAPRAWVSGVLQPQFEIHGDDGTVTSRTLFRRIIVRVDGVAGNWHGQVETDLGPTASGSNTRVFVKNAFVQYTGWQRRRGLLLTMGNQKLPFSRSYYGSGSKRSFMERPFTGDRAYGSPGRAMAVKVDRWQQGNRIFWSAALAETRQSPEAGELRLDGAAENTTGWQKGPLLAGRFEVHPRGEMTRDHGDFGRKPWKYTVGVAGYRWWNDNDVARRGGTAVDARRAAAFEVSGGVRGGGVSIEAEFDHITASTIDPGLTAGVYAGGHVTIDKASLETGYMLVRDRLEMLGGLDRLEVDAFDVPWRRVAGGLAWYVNGHQLQFSLMHRESFNDRGVDHARSRATYAQAQFAF
jgi:hypothetical protein